MVEKKLTDDLFCDLIFFFTPRIIIHESQLTGGTNGNDPLFYGINLFKESFLLFRVNENLKLLIV